jgi:membrane-associated phospholipid phosphatase
MAVDVGRVVFWSVLASTPLALAVFRARTWGGGFLHNLRRLGTDYAWHWLLFVAILVEKNWVDELNDPIRGVFGDKTWLLWDIEGGLTQWIQATFEHPWLTAVLNVHYLWAYVFLNYFTVILFAYRDDRELANVSALNYSIIYILAIPFYIFFNVQVTSDFIPGMKALLYHAGPGFYSFFTAHDPLDNAWPSLHIAIPFGLILCLWWAMRRRGYTLRDWEHRGYLWFIILNTAVFAFSILYLGIHWATDIPGGMLVGLLGASIADELQGPVFAFLKGVQRKAARQATALWKRLRRAPREVPGRGPKA